MLFGACVGTPVIYDENLPMEESARLFFMPGIEVTSYNGIPVPTKKSLMHGFGYKSEWQYVSLPPGEMEFVVDIYVNYGGFIYTAKEAIFKYTFGEKEYCLNFSFGGDENSLWGISIYEQSPKEMKLIKENRIDFVPFHGQDKDKEKGRTVFQ